MNMTAGKLPRKQLVPKRVPKPEYAKNMAVSTLKLRIFLK